jgi:hypothetical protein
MFAYDGKSIKTIKGFFLLEMMLVIVLGLFIWSFVLEIFLTAQRSYRMQLAIHHLENHAKTAIDFLTADLQKAGHIGCARLTSDFPFDAPKQYQITLINKLSSETVNELEVRYVKLPGVTLRETMQDAYHLLTSVEEKFKPNAALVISNCQQAEVFQVGNIYYLHGLQNIVSSSALHKKFAKNAEVGQLMIHRFYIDKTNRKNTDGSLKYALFMEDRAKSFSIHKMEVAEGITGMQVTFIIKQAGKIIKLAANKHNNEGNVLGIGIDLDLVEPPLRKVWHIYISLHEK